MNDDTKSDKKKYLPVLPDNFKYKLSKDIILPYRVTSWFFKMFNWF